MGRVEGKVAFITGAARGQGRSHAVRLAEEGADVIVLDICHDLHSVPYPLGTRKELEETAATVIELGRRCELIEADVRDLDMLTRELARATGTLGGLDIVCANAGIGTFIPIDRMRADHWELMIDINLTGVWNTVKASIAPIRKGGRGASIILTSSAAGLRGFANGAHYAAAKHGLVGMMKALANELGPSGIRVNTIHPTGVSTPMIHNDSTYKLFDPSEGGPDMERVEEAFAGLNILPVPWVDPVDVSNAVLFLASDEARFVTGTKFAVDAGCSERTI
jgi:SDR family mycofactocin-dependent oxidoreductase